MHRSGSVCLVSWTDQCSAWIWYVDFGCLNPAMWLHSKVVVARLEDCMHSDVPVQNGPGAQKIDPCMPAILGHISNISGKSPSWWHGSAHSARKAAFAPWLLELLQGVFEENVDPSNGASAEYGANAGAARQSDVALQCDEETTSALPSPSAVAPPSAKWE